MADGFIVCFVDLDSKQKREAIEVFVDGFRNVFTFAKTKDELIRLFSVSFEESLVYAYVAENRVCGVLGVGTNTKRALHLDKEVFETVFGKLKGSMSYSMLHRIAEKPVVKNDNRFVY